MPHFNIEDDKGNIDIQTQSEYPNYIAVGHTSTAYIFGRNRQILESTQRANHRPPDPRRISPLPIEIDMQFFTVPAQFLVNPVLQPLQHR